MLYCKCKSHYHYKFCVIRHFIIQYHFMESLINIAFFFDLGLKKMVQKIYHFILFTCRKVMSKSFWKCFVLFCFSFSWSPHQFTSIFLSKSVLLIELPQKCWDIFSAQHSYQFAGIHEKPTWPQSPSERKWSLELQATDWQQAKNCNQMNPAVSNSTEATWYIIYIHICICMHTCTAACDTSI